jgi:hypothetical protein
MKKFLIIICSCFIFMVAAAQDLPCINVTETCNSDCGLTYCGPYELSESIFRIPFVNGTTVEVICDHFSHCPRGRIDMIGIDGDFNGDYHIAAAAAGWIRAIVDNHSVQCNCSQTFCENNYVWMEHANGEWTKYTHFKQNSVTNLNHFEGEFVSAGTYLGDEGDVGCAGGVHLHFEAAQPIDTNTLVFSESGGYIDETWAKNVIPVFCGILNNVMNAGSEYLAGDCASTCGGFIAASKTIEIGEFDVILNDDAISNEVDYTIEGYGAGLFQAANEITLKAGFEVLQNATFDARIGDCGESPLRNSTAQESSIKELDESGFGIYPNPATRLVTLEWMMPEESKVSVSFTDMGRRTLLRPMTNELFLQGQYEKTFDVTSLQPGMYLVVLEMNQFKEIQKLVVQR